MAEFVKFEVPEKLMGEQLALVERIAKGGKLKVGVNEVTKAVERGNAKLVLIALDVEPQELVMHLPLICGEKGIPFSYAKTRKELGERAGVSVGTAALAVVDEGDSKRELQGIVKRLSELRK